MCKVLVAIAFLATLVTPLQAASAAPATSSPTAGTGFRARLGAEVIELTPELRQHLGAAPERGVLVSRVLPGSSAAAAGISVGDVLVEIDGRPVMAARDVVSALSSRAAGDRVPVVLVRNRTQQTVSATLHAYPVAAFDFFWPLRHWMRGATASSPRSCEA